MGCGAAKGTQKDEAIKFKHMGVHSMDLFFTKCDQMMKDFAAITEPLRTEREKFFEATGFYAVPGAST